MANFFKRLFGNDEPAKKESVKEEDRYFFYDDRCSFKLSKDDILLSKVEDDGKKYGFMTKTMGYLSIEILIEEQPILACNQADFVLETLGIEVFRPQHTDNGYLYYMEKNSTIDTIRCCINCGDFWVEVNMDKGAELFLDSFKVEK